MTGSTNGKEGLVVSGSKRFVVDIVVAVSLSGDVGTNVEYFLFRVASFWTFQNLFPELLEILRSLLKHQFHFLNRSLLPC